jgi:Rha family phage regulatory protein
MLDTTATFRYSAPTAETSVDGFESLLRNAALAATALKHCGFFVQTALLGWGERRAQARWLRPRSASLSIRSSCPPLFESKGALNAQRNDGMTQPATTGITAHIALIDGALTTTTHDIATVYGKRHNHVLEIVRKRMEEAGEWGMPNFKHTPYTNPQNGQTYPVIRMTKKGFHFVVGKFTGAKAVQHQIAFADAFERMEAQQSPALANDEGAPITPITPTTPIALSFAQRRAIRDALRSVYLRTHDDPAVIADTFRRQFNVVDYRDLPPDQYQAAINFLGGLMPPRVAPLHLPKPAATKAAQANSAALLPGARYLTHLDPRTGCAVHKPIATNAYVMSLEQFLQAMHEPNGVMVSAEQLAQFMLAATQRLARLCEFYQTRAMGAPQLTAHT